MICAVAGNPGLGSSLAQASAQAFAGAASSGGSGATASASAFAQAISQGGASSQAAALALAQSFAYGTQASAFAQAIALVISQRGCQFVQPVLAQAWHLTLPFGSNLITTHNAHHVKLGWYLFDFAC